MAYKVMIIEDEEALALLLKYNLEKEGYEVQWQSRGNKALAEIENSVDPFLKAKDMPIDAGTLPSSNATVCSSSVFPISSELDLSTVIPQF